MLKEETSEQTEKNILTRSIYELKSSDSLFIKMLNIAKIPFNIIFLILMVLILILYILVIGALIFFINCIPFLGDRKREFLNIQLKKLFFKIAHSIFGFWFSSNIKIHYLRNDLNNLKNTDVLSISNHISDYDWLFTSFLMNKLNLLDKTIITMRSELLKIPIIDQILRVILKAFNTVFLIRTNSRKNPYTEEQKEAAKAENQSRINASLSRFSKVGLKCNPLIYVEGTYNCVVKYKECIVNYLMNQTKSDEKEIKEFVMNDLMINKSQGNFDLSKKDEFIEKINNYVSENKKDDGEGEISNQKNFYFPYYTLNPKYQGLVDMLLNPNYNYTKLLDITLIPNPYNRFMYDNYGFIDFLLFGVKKFNINILVDSIDLNDNIKNHIKEARGDISKRGNLEVAIFDLLKKRYEKKERIIEEYVKNGSHIDFNLKIYKLSRIYEKLFFSLTILMIVLILFTQIYNPFKEWTVLNLLKKYKTKLVEPTIN